MRCSICSLRLAWHGAGVRHTFEDFFVFVGVAFVGHRDDDLDKGDAARVGAHCLGDFGRGTGDVQTVEVGVDAHGGEDAAAECRGTKVGGGKGFAFAVVVFGSVGDDFGALAVCSHSTRRPPRYCAFISVIVFSFYGLIEYGYCFLDVFNLFAGDED